MCEKPKDGNKIAKAPDETGEEHSYYYDDAHGYEDFDPAADEPESDEDEAEGSA